MLGQVLYEADNLNVTTIENDILKYQNNGAYNVILMFNDFTYSSFKIIKM